MVLPTIAAISTPIGTGGIGVIRVSGTHSLSIARDIFLSNTFSKNAHDFVTHRLYYGRIINPINDHIIDEVLLVYMKAPHTYTKEDVVEIQSHSGHYVLQSILELVLHHGAELAEPGEFTKRAFLNGRIDLTQAESVMDIINARSQASHQIAISQIQGDLKQQILSMSDILLGMLSELQAFIDFPDDIEETFEYTPYQLKISQQILPLVVHLIKRNQNAHFLRDGIKLLIVGAPNVGKSSLLNSLIENDRAIVTHIPGTTRDTLEEPLNLNGLPFVVIDSAGIHNTTNTIESLGIQRTTRFIHKSDIILLVIDATAPFTPSDLSILEKIKSRPYIIVFNKMDLIPNDSSPTLPQSIGNTPCVYISALKNIGMDSLKALLVQIALERVDYDTSGVVPNARHLAILNNIQHFLQNILDQLSFPLNFELITLDLEECIQLFNQITGDTVKPDILDTIFSRFCIGK